MELLQSVLELHRNHARDAGDTIAMAFEAGSFTQASHATWMPELTFPRKHRLVLALLAIVSACLSFARLTLMQMNLRVECFDRAPGLLLNTHCVQSQAISKRCACQVLDFVEFKERLERSHTRAVARSESAVYRVQVAAAGAAAKGDFGGAQLVALETLSDLQQPPDAYQVPH